MSAEHEYKIPIMTMDGRFEESKRESESESEGFGLDEHDISSHATLVGRSELLLPHPAASANGTAINATKPNTGSRSTVFLDGLRGLASLFVFVQHFVPGFDLNVHEHGFGENGNWYFASLPFVRIVFNGGGAAVSIFFVLSGYVLSKSPLALLYNGQRRACETSLVSAVVRRPIRLYLPPLVVTLAFAVMLHAPFSLLPSDFWLEPLPSLVEEVSRWFVESIKFFSPFQTHSNARWFLYSMVVWTLPIELKGSMLVYGLTAIAAYTGVRRSVILPLLMLSVLVLLHIGVWTMACFIAGHILAYIDISALDTEYLARRLTLRAQSLVWHLCFVIGYYLVCQPAHDGEPQYSSDTPGWHYLSLMIPNAYDKTQYYRFWVSWGAILVVYATLRLPWLQRFLNTRPLRYLGKVSFMLYLVHWPFLAFFGHRLNHLFGQIDFGATKTWWDNRLYIPDFGPRAMSSRFFACILVVLPICLALADLATKYVDTPSVRLGKKLVQRLGLDRTSLSGNRN